MAVMEKYCQYLVLFSMAVIALSSPFEQDRPIKHSKKKETAKFASCNSNTEFLCASGSCITGNRRCDGHPDCAGGDDEQGCVCPDDMFQCWDGQCVTGRCNKEFDCPRGEDELHCGCRPDQFMCVFNGNCIPRTWLCDMWVDCLDASDEYSCMLLQQQDKWKQKETGGKKTEFTSKKIHSQIDEDGKRVAQKLFTMLIGDGIEAD